jgi:hypothetical protein
MFAFNDSIKDCSITFFDNLSLTSFFNADVYVPLAATGVGYTQNT